MARVQKLRKEQKRFVEKKGVRWFAIWRICEISEEAGKKGLARILGRVRGWRDAGSLTEGVAITTKEEYHMSYEESSKIGRDAERQEKANPRPGYQKSEPRGTRP